MSIAEVFSYLSVLYEIDFLTVVFCISLLALLALKAKASKLEQNCVKHKSVQAITNISWSVILVIHVF